MDTYVKYFRMKKVIRSYTTFLLLNLNQNNICAPSIAENVIKMLKLMIYDVSFVLQFYCSMVFNFRSLMIKPGQQARVIQA